MRVLIVLVVAVAATIAVVSGVLERGTGMQERFDPAIAFHTSNHGDGYGGIDRWAYYGMHVNVLGGKLKAGGYACAPGETSSASTLSLVCTKSTSWLLPRTLTIRSTIDNDLGGRLVAASAHSVATGRAGLVNFARGKGWIEPESLEVRGLEIDNADLLARFVSSIMLLGSRFVQCEEPGMQGCQMFAAERGRTGLPEAPKSLAVGDAIALHGALRRLGFVLANGQRDPFDKAMNVRLSDGQLWVDFEARDLSGRASQIAVALTSPDGKPVKMITQVGNTKHTIALEGAAYMANRQYPMLLLPESGNGDRRVATWIRKPDPREQRSIDALAVTLPRTGPEFIAPVLQILLGGNGSPEQDNDLYPALGQIEARAAVLRQANAPSWLPAERSAEIVRAAYRSDPIGRAAWAMAQCEAGSPPVMDLVCWHTFTNADPEAADLLRTELSALERLYEPLASLHPLRQHLKALREVTTAAESTLVVKSTLH